jgi:hypothetical protein
MMEARGWRDHLIVKVEVRGVDSDVSMRIRMFVRDLGRNVGGMGWITVSGNFWIYR